MKRSLPDFKRATRDTVGKRAAFLCSNPDCRAPTVGPNSNQEKATTIGEAAHIFGARPGATRYMTEMTDAARASITNAIWLCRNCHKMIDADERRFSPDVLYTWLDQHDKHCSLQLGNATDRIHFDRIRSEAFLFKNYPALIRRIVVDRPDGWEWRLTAELLRHLTRPLFRKIRDLRDGLYIKPLEHIDEADMLTWFENRLAEMSTLIEPMTVLIDRLNRSWGRPGQNGDLEEIHHVCKLIRDNVEQVVSFEERVRFTHVPEQYKTAVSTLQGVIGTQIEKLGKIPTYLDEVVSLLEEDSDESLLIERTIVFDLPPGWEKQLMRQVRRAHRSSGTAFGCFSVVSLLAVPVLCIKLLA